MNSLVDKLDWTSASLPFIIPEIVLSAGILILIIAGLIFKQARVAQIITAASLIISILFILTETTINVQLFFGMLRSNGTSSYLRLLFSSTGLVITVVSNPNRITKNQFEYFTLIMSIILGSELLVMSEHFVMVLLSIELLSIPAYILSGFDFTKQSAEASLKYFVYGSVATACMIFGMSWLYGFGDGLYFSSPTFIENLKNHNNVVLFDSGIMMLAGLFFKMAATPFHFWAPDVYESTPMPVLALFSTVPKIAAGSLIVKLAFVFQLQGMSRYDWQTVLAVLSIATLTIGNFSALLQSNVKRLMAYSSIGQAGFLLTAISCFSDSNRFFLFYAVVLTIANLVIILILQHTERQFGTKQIRDFAGLGRIAPMNGVILLIGFLSLVGLPLTAGFNAKLFIFSNLLESYSSSDKSILITLFVFGLLNTVVSLYYYLKIPYWMFLKESQNQASLKSNFKSKLDPAIVTSLLLSILLILFFLKPNWLLIITP